MVSDLKSWNEYVYLSFVRPKALSEYSVDKIDHWILPVQWLKKATEEIKMRSESYDYHFVLMKVETSKTILFERL